MLSGNAQQDRKTECVVFVHISEPTCPSKCTQTCPSKYNL